MDNIFPIVLWMLVGAVLAALLWLAWKTVNRRWLTRRATSRREVLEDALKLIFNLQQEGQPADKYRLAVELKLGITAVEALITRLVAQGLVLEPHGTLSLTPGGQRWALQVIRAHRLWERYLADEVRMPLEKVHTAAHRREHRMSASEVDELDAALGHPTHDPHGDPIPDAAGHLRESGRMTHLTDLQVGQNGTIVQLEDEPPLAYAQLLAEGLFVGQQVIVQENSPQRIVLSDAEREYTLAPSIAGNVFLHVQPAAQPPDPSLITLGSLPNRKKAEIVRIDERCQGFTRRRFLDLGLTPGTLIYPELENAFREPRAYRLRGTLIALRSDQASLIWVRPAAAAARNA